MNLEEELRAALARGFAERVLERAGRRRRTAYRAAAWAAAAGLVLTGGLEYRRQAEGRRAKDQTMLALRIAARELNSVQQKMERLRAASAAGEKR
jgi:hypothetical protein